MATVEQLPHPPSAYTFVRRNATPGRHRTLQPASKYSTNGKRVALIGGHGRHADRFAVENVPLVHRRHAVAPPPLRLLLYAPAGHRTHTLGLRTSMYVPEGHAVHAVPCGGTYCPSVQPVQKLLPAGTYCPAAHAAQLAPAPLDAGCSAARAPQATHPARLASTYALGP